MSMSKSTGATEATEAAEATEATEATPSASELITREVTSWPGVTAGPGRRGEFAFRVGRRESGHLHGDRSAHFSFPKAIWSELIQEGRIEPHPVFPDAQGPGARRIRSDEDVAEVLVLLRLNYDRLSAGTGADR